MIPGNPRQLPPIRAQARRSVKILPRQQYTRLAADFRIDGDNGVHRFAAGAMVFANTKEAATVAIYHGIGITPFFTGGNRMR
ncbi:hypothetical protein D3C83_146620 [compost metagenome]